MSTEPNHIAIETSGRTGSVALLSNGSVMDQILLSANPRLTQSLAPALLQMLERLGQGISSLQWISVAVGPGSFTGLRVGVTTAKSLAYASQAALLGVDCLEILAYQALHHPVMCQARYPINVAAAIKAYRGQVYCAIWRISRQDASTGAPPEVHPTPQANTAAKMGTWEVIEPEQALPQGDWIARVKSLVWQQNPGMKEPVYLVGDGFAGTQGELAEERGRSQVLFVDESTWVPLASYMGKLAWTKLERGERDDFWKLEPRYLRPSAAEENSP